MKKGDNQRVGLTTTIPVEIVFAAGKVPVDLNNIFITSPQKEAFIAKAEAIGFPRNTCGWIKGIYGVTLEEGIKEVVAVTQGDCSNTHALMEVLQTTGVRIFPFAYPYDQDRHLLALQIEQMTENLKNMQMNLALVKQQQDYLNVKSPVDGQLGSLTVEIGQSITRGFRIGQINILTSYKI
jgi:benzoyl-CoA reductase/2-hydroxyglutaryl-CoA dehydratase subunit BcrC/BadD/HgdB